MGAVVAQDKLTDFRNFVAAYGFAVDVLSPAGAPLPANVTVHVPLGAALAAVPVVRSAPGAVTADVYGFGGAPESTAPLPGCPTNPVPAYRGGSCTISVPGQVCTPTASTN